MFSEFRIHDSGLFKAFSREKLQIIVAFLGFGLIGINDGVIGVVIPSLMHDYSLDKTTIGWLFLIRTIGYFTFALIEGIIVEKIGLRLFLMLGSIMFLLGSLILSLMLPLWAVIISFLFLGCAGVIFETGLNFYIAKLPNNRSFLNYLHSCYGIGALLGPVIAAALLFFDWSWNNVYFVVVGISLLLLIGFGLIFPKQDTLTEEDEADIKSNVLVDTIKLPVVWLGAIFLVLYVGAELSLGNWSYSLLTEERSETVLLSGWIVSGYWFGLTVGRLILGKVSEWLEEQQIVQICLAAIIVGMALVWLNPHLIVTAIGLWLAGFGLGPLYPTTIALMSSLVPTRILPSAIGVMATGDSLGAALLPWLAGFLANNFGLWSLMPYLMIITLGMLFLWRILSAFKSSLILENIPKSVKVS